MKDYPIRTCIACRKKSEQKNLLKLVRTKDNAFVLNDGKTQGRSAYFCKDDACIEKIISKKMFNKSFHCNIDNEIYEQLKKMN